MELTLALATTSASFAVFAVLLIALVLVILGIVNNSTKHVGIGLVVLIVGLMLVEVFKVLGT